MSRRPEVLVFPHRVGVANLSEDFPQKPETTIFVTTYIQAMKTKPPLSRKATAARDAYLNLMRVHEHLGGQFAALFRDHGLTQAQYNVLRILSGGPKQGAPCQYVGDRLVNRVPDVTRLIDRMEKAGLVTRVRDSKDRRVVLIRITPKGSKTCDALRNPTLDLHVRQFQSISLAQIQALNTSLQEILEG